MFAELSHLHGDKAVWKLLNSGLYDVREVSVAGPVPVDVDTWQDYEALLAGDQPRTSDHHLRHDRSRTQA